MPRLLDLFCGAGGCSVGYARAGFDVTGVDNRPHPDYPYPFILADALDVLADLDYLRTFDVIHASPPCPRYSKATPISKREEHPDLIGPTREALLASGVPYVIENVPGSPLVGAATLCGRALGMPHIRRHRLIESSEFLLVPPCACGNQDSGTVSIFGNSGADYRTGRHNRPVRWREARSLLGVEWMNDRRDVSDCVPPPYTEFLGTQLRERLGL